MATNQRELLKYPEKKDLIKKTKKKKIPWHKQFGYEKKRRVGPIKVGWRPVKPLFPVEHTHPFREPLIRPTETIKDTEPLASININKLPATGVVFKLSTEKPKALTPVTIFKHPQGKIKLRDAA